MNSFHVNFTIISFVFLGLGLEYGDVPCGGVVAGVWFTFWLCVQLGLLPIGWQDTWGGHHDYCQWWDSERRHLLPYHYWETAETSGLVTDIRGSGVNKKLVPNIYPCRRLQDKTDCQCWPWLTLAVPSYLFRRTSSWRGGGALAIKPSWAVRGYNRFKISLLWHHITGIKSRLLWLVDCVLLVVPMPQQCLMWQSSPTELVSSSA